MITSKKMICHFLILLSVSGGILFLSCSSLPSLPVTRSDNIQDTLHGVMVADPYRWLENWQDPAVQKWSDQQNQYARYYLDRLPNRQALENRLGQIYRQATPSYFNLQWTGGKFFAVKNQPPLNQPLLVYLTSIDDPAREKIILDLNVFDTTHQTSMDWYKPSPDGKLVAVSLSVGGSETGNVHIFDSETGQQVFEVIPWVNKGTAGGDLAWVQDGKGFYYTRYPHPGERAGSDLNFYQQVWFHQLGTSIEQDRYIIGKEFPRIVEIRLNVDPTSNILLVTTQYGDGGMFAHYLVYPDGKSRQLTRYEDDIIEIQFAPRNSLMLISRRNAPKGQILILPLSNPDLKKARILIPETENAICSEFGEKSLVAPLQNLIYVTYQMGGPAEIITYNSQGKREVGPDLLSVASIHEITPLENDEILFCTSSFLVPRSWFHYRPKEKVTRKLAISSRSSVDFSDCEVRREFAISKDGTCIPINIIKRKTVSLDGNNPTILYGYGGFGISETPNFSASLRVWIEQDGIYAVANLRGGSEYGEEWHRAGMLTNKQNVFDDFAAAMKYLIENRYTNPQKLAITGGSNGGLLMGAMITQHPELFKATVSSVGIYDMLRNELSPNGSFNIPEYGTVQNEEQFKAMYAYSPYHNVKDGTAYPAVLFMTGANDPRVDPMQSRKMTARLQAANSSQNPILLRTSSTTGHGSGTPLEERIREAVDRYSFLFYQLGVNYKPVL